MTTRRLFLAGAVSALAAPAIVRAGSLMKIWVPPKRLVCVSPFLEFPYDGLLDLSPWKVWYVEEVDHLCGVPRIVTRSIPWADVYK